MNNIFTSLTLAAVFSVNVTESKASEFFLKINRQGQHTVLVNDQYQTNNSNVYRFFDLPTGTATLKVSDANTGAALFDGSVNLGLNERVVAEMAADGNITVIHTSTVTYTNWYTQSNQNATNTTQTTVLNTPPPPPPPPPAPVPVGVEPERFKEIVSAIRAQTVESYKLDKAKSLAKKNTFSSQQVADICKLFNVESYKLEFAKFAYDYTADKENYFLVGKVFKVASYSRDLDKYIDSK